jgi:hypothetical protein
MNKINLIPDIFAGGKGVTNKIPKYFIWDSNSNQNDISFYVDMGITKAFKDSDNGKLKFLWLIESPSFNNNVFEIIKNNLQKTLSTFEMIFTYSEELLSLDDKFKMCPANGPWIMSPKIYDKTKLLSMIVSSKTFTHNQSLRVNFANENKHRLDLFGRGFNPIETKEEGLNDYMFSICMENNSYDGYFTEKILDCFATGTIPIYLGSRKITNHFDENGIIFFEDFDFSKISKELYLSKMESIKINYKKVLEFLCPEDFIYEKYLHFFLKK